MRNSHAVNLRCLSVVIPARDEEGCIASTVEHLHLELNLRGVPHEIIVVDDGSTDRTWEILQQEAERMNGGEGNEARGEGNEARGEGNEARGERRALERSGRLWRRILVVDRRGLLDRYTCQVYITQTLNVRSSNTSDPRALQRRNSLDARFGSVVVWSVEP